MGRRNLVLRHFPTAELGLVTKNEGMQIFKANDYSNLLPTLFEKFMMNNKHEAI